MQLIPTSANGFGHNLNENLGFHEKGCQSRSCRTMPLVGPSTKQVNRSMCFPKELAGFSYMHMLPTSFVLCLINHMSVFSNIWIHFPFFIAVHILWVNTDAHDINVLPPISLGPWFHTTLSAHYELLCCKEMKASSKLFVCVCFPLKGKECLQTSSN